MGRGRCVRLIVVGAVLVLLRAAVTAESPSAPGLGSMVTGDFKYLVDNVQLDLQDVVTAPLHLTSEDSVLRSPRFYLTLAGVGAVWGGAFALDQTMRSHLHTMSSSDADLLEGVSYGSVGASAGLLYAYGFYSDDTRARQATLTGGEGAGFATLVNVGIKTAFGRLRPRQDHHSHTAFFRGGASFVSGDVTPMFGLAAGISESFDNEWYVATPAYSLALLDGFGRMGHDAHWFSDVVGAGLLGWGTTELFLYLHHEHEGERGRWHIFPVTPAPSDASGKMAALPTGMGVEYQW
jgi:membrane-associated phospholipid phosphatase